MYQGRNKVSAHCSWPQPPDWDFTPFISKSFKSETTSFHYFSPKDSESLNFLDIRFWEVGAKRLLNGTSKSEQTDTQTPRHMDKSNYRKHWPTGSMLWKSIFELSSILGETKTKTLARNTIFGAVMQFSNLPWIAIWLQRLLEICNWINTGMTIIS